MSYLVNQHQQKEVTVLYLFWDVYFYHSVVIFKQKKLDHSVQKEHFNANKNKIHTRLGFVDYQNINICNNK